jgi:hypothetical protein
MKMARMQILLIGVGTTLVMFLISCCIRSCREVPFVLGMLSEMNREKTAGRRRLLCETNYGELLAACRQLLGQVDSGKVKPGTYDFGSSPDRKVLQFPQAIVDLRPKYVYIEAGRVMIEMMGGLDHFGVLGYLEDYRAPVSDYKYGDKELIPGLWYYDDGYDENRRYSKEIDDLIEKCKRE